MNYGQKIMLKALTKGVVPDCEREEFDDWKFNHSSDEMLDALIEIGAALRRKHIFWGAGEPDCPREIKAPNGELHTLRCKVCGIDGPKSFCLGELEETK